MQQFLDANDVIDFLNPSIQALAEQLRSHDSQLDTVRQCFGLYTNYPLANAILSEAPVRYVISLTSYTQDQEEVS